LEFRNRKDDCVGTTSVTYVPEGGGTDT
jgi:hypothetical protein